MDQELIIQAIKHRKPIEFEYNKPGKIQGKRIGNPHCIFVHPGTSQVDVDVFQTSGVSDSDLTLGLPWRRFTLAFMDNVRMMEKFSEFGIGEGYNLHSVHPEDLDL